MELALFNLYIYFKAIPPSIMGGDSGEVCTGKFRWKVVVAAVHPMDIACLRVNKTVANVSRNDLTSLLTEVENPEGGGQYEASLFSSTEAQCPRTS